MNFLERIQESFFWGEEGGVGARVSDLFTKNPNLKKKLRFVGRGGGGLCGGGLE